jgi:sodium transport system ATP-binding protein
LIELNGLEKVYSSRGSAEFRAVDGITFTCRPGEVFGLLGPNGAGKTTTLRIIATALRPTKGSAAVMGFDTSHQPEQVRRRLGFLSAQTGLYPRLTPREHFRFFGRVYGMDSSSVAARIDEVAAKFRMEDFLDRQCDKLSTGMKQKVSIARSVFHNPDVIVMDEPTTGLDVLTSRTIISFIRDCRNEGRTVLFSSHIMAEVEALCDRVAIIHRGHIRFIGSMDELHHEFGADMETAFLRVLGEVPA